MKHHKYYHYPEVKNARLNARAEAALDFITALAIGSGLAWLIAAWWLA
jgi:SAM-dependent MidA family methyltransferase